MRKSLEHSEKLKNNTSIKNDALLHKFSHFFPHKYVLSTLYCHDCMRYLYEP